MLKKFGQILNNKSSSSYSKKTVSDETASLFDFITLIKNWKEVVGEMLGANSIPLKINHGTLTIITKHSAISNELNFMSTMIKTNIVKAYPQLRNQIDKIYFQNSPAIFDQMKKDEIKYDEEKVIKKNLNHPFSPEYIERLATAKEFYKEVLSDKSVGEIDPEIEALLLSMKIQKDRSTQDKS
ncbi:MAG: DUF721 domain-containing protein [Bacteriovoracaceae bacterium]